MFVKGNLVRLITESGTAPIVQVIEDEFDGAVQIATTDDLDIGNYVSADDYELVAERLEECIPEPVPNFTPSHSVDQIHEELEMLIVQLVQYHQASEVAGALHIRIEADSYGNDDNVTVEYGAYIGGGETVITRRLDRSVELAIDRAKENEENKPKEIAFKGRDAA